MNILLCIVPVQRNSGERRRRRPFDTPQQRRSEFRSKNKHKRLAPFEYSRRSNRHILFKNYPRLETEETGGSPLRLVI